ncbi:tetratricopeptide repeat protein [Methanobrevibacter sp.]|uniref:tetratricopeptide repeat protein n=1 Tax=Methanobrevibacter sp. TaxID=66852 RepID=UPI0025E7FB8C|nr:tetratricopeptide repeat protein [Methanobrevibacter sp.]MBQ2665815.1 tetratricopeptide repeat protein [Methanobrevibacter sp.]
MADNEEDIKVNRKKGDKVYFESTFLQRISDGIDFIWNESREILEELDENLDVSDFDDFSEKTLNSISDIVDELSQLKSEIISYGDVPESVVDSTRNIKVALNRDHDYVRRAKRRLDRVNSDEFVDVARANIRVIELCDKAIDVNPSNADAYYIKGRALSNLDKYPEAIDEFINSLAVRDDLKVWIAIANTNTLNGDYDDAIDVYDRVLQKDENSFDAIKGKALTYYASDDYKKADEEFKKASSIGTLDSISKEIWDECLEKI